MPQRQQPQSGNQLDDLLARIEENERRIDRLETTLNAVARETGNLSVRHVCGNCKACHMLDADGLLYCPSCGNQQSV